MNLYFAPLEGVTSCTYRTTHAKIFGGCEAYYAPFITPSDIERFSIKSLRDVMPEKNQGIDLKVQVLTCQSESFKKFAEKVKSIGYNEVNINLGCPSGTVVKKNRGSGFLRTPEELDRFLYEVYSENDIKITIKTRAGFFNTSELDNLIEIYNKYPSVPLIIHPRSREDYYKGEPDNDAFKRAYEISKNKLCYNGNIFSRDDYIQISEEFPMLEGVMIGRGAIANPAIFREIKGGAPLTTSELIEFSDILIENYTKVLVSEHYVLNKIKEIWLLMMLNFPEEKKILKAVKKASKVMDIVTAVNNLPEIKR
ncbi:MAG: tRNA-dihydrouridine synthase family protein [Clostridia bacterium]|nr:tRNA-dihydrouridine synthase family protein [Clostridia bacterium]